MNKLKLIEKEVRDRLSRIHGSHDWEHTKRVYNMALHIGKKEKADILIIKLAALLHDIARDEQDRSNGKICHAKKGAEIAQKILIKYKFSKGLIDQVLHCIQAHRFREKTKPDSLEAKVLFDSDKLDSIGAVGIARAYHFAGSLGAKLHNKDVDIAKTKSYSTDDTGYREYLVKLKYIKNIVYTNEGKRIARERHKFMESYFNRLNKEVEGKL
ncbi:MAG: HD domain-containing protein [Elusimicrobia bacterium]|nr:HD domain-containing protein [Candidatus Liberimonas magnetica]